MFKMIDRATIEFNKEAKQRQQQNEELKMIEECQKQEQAKELERIQQKKNKKRRILLNNVIVILILFHYYMILTKMRDNYILNILVK